MRLGNKQRQNSKLRLWEFSLFINEKFTFLLNKIKIFKIDIMSWIIKQLFNLASIPGPFGYIKLPIYFHQFEIVLIIKRGMQMVEKLCHFHHQLELRELDTYPIPRILKLERGYCRPSYMFYFAHIHYKTKRWTWICLLVNNSMSGFDSSKSIINSGLSLGRSCGPVAWISFSNKQMSNR